MHAMKALKGSGDMAQFILCLAVDGVQGSASHHGHCITRERASRNQ